MFILAMDYDGTMFEGQVYGELGTPRMDIINKVKEFQKTGLCEVILWSCRDAGPLQEAINRCKEYGIEFDSVNSNSLSQVMHMRRALQKGQVFATRKIFADVYIDDRSPGSIEYFLAMNVEETVKRFEKRQ